MDKLLELKINNIINEINNQLNKDEIDAANARTLLAVSVNRINLLMTHIGYLENKLNLQLNNTEPTLLIDEDWNIDFSHGPEANYLVHGEAIQMLVDHIKYIHVLIENCPGKKDVE